MKKLLLLVPILLTTLYSCSSDNDNEENVVENIIPEATNLKMDIELSTNKFEIGKPISYTVNSNENITEVSTSLDNWKTSYGKGFTIDFNFNLSKSIKVIQSLHEIGQKTIYVMIKNEKNETVKKSFQVEIIKGESVKIKSIKVISFKNINGIWDTEYTNDNINRLADLKFLLRKNFITTSIDEPLKSSLYDWYFTEELFENQSNLTWNLNNKGIYIDPNQNFIFNLVDMDGTSLPETIHNINDFNFKDYILNKPNFITFKRGELEIEFELEW
ncbi:MAG TPA: hypothetical protein VIV55_07350 [Flavobacterium sp.]